MATWFRSWALWRQERQKRRDRFLAREAEHSALLKRQIREANFDSFKDFYNSNDSRRGDDVSITQVEGGELRWNVCWLPRTTEVVAFSAAWADERWHAMLHGGAPADVGGPGSDPVRGPAPVPQAVLLLGHAPTSDDAQRRLDQCATLDDCRLALAAATP